MIVDEAHRLKNSASLLSQNLKLLKNDYKLFPNPVEDELNIELLNSNFIKNASLSSVTGQILGVEIRSNVLNTTNLASGIYILTIETENGIIVEKIIKE